MFSHFPVHNWTQDDVIRWLREFVELPQYEKNFKDFKVNGNTLPRWSYSVSEQMSENTLALIKTTRTTSLCLFYRIAANEPSFLSGQLRVQDPRDKQKLNIKALDVVLFGPPTRKEHG